MAQDGSDRRGVHEVTDDDGDSLDPATVQMFVSVDDGGVPVTVGAVAPMGGGLFAARPSPPRTASRRSAALPHLVASDTDGDAQSMPLRTLRRRAFVGASPASGIVVGFDNDFETNQGWTVDQQPWPRRTARGPAAPPMGGGDRGDPPADFDGSGQCWLTDNVDGNSDVDGGQTILTSPVLDASEATTVRYMRWYSNTFGASPNADVFVVEISDDGGSSWSELEVVGPGGPEADGGWYAVEFDLATVAGFTANDQFRIRYNASDLGDGSVVEAAVDGFVLIGADCDDPGVEGDVDGDGDVDFQDIVALLAAWGPCPGCAADLDGNGTVDFTDLLTLLAAYGG